LLNPIPHIFSISPPNGFVGASDLTLTLTGADFVPGAVVRWNGSDRATTFVGERLIRAVIPAADLQAEGVAQVTVFNPAPGGGVSSAVGFYICGGTILFTGPNNGAWQTPGNWNTGNLPGPSDAVCIGPTSRVVLSFNSYTIGSLRSYGGLEISSNGSLAITGSSFINNAFTLTVNGTLDGSGDLAVNGTFVWQRGTVRGSGTLTANGSIALSDGGAGYRNLIGRTLTNVSTASWTDNQIFQLSEGASFTNQGTFEAQSDQPFLYGGGGAPVAFNNSGTFRKSVGTGTIVFDIPFNNIGTVRVQSGTLELRRTGLGSGDYSVDSAATLRFREDRTLSGSVSGAGTASFDAPINTAGIVNITGTYNVSGTTSINHSTVNFNPGMTLVSLGVLVLDDASTVNFSSGTPITQSTFTLAGLSTLTGSDSFTVTNLFNWRGGTISGSGAFIANGGISFGTPAYYKYLVGRTLTNLGSAAWADGYQAAVFLNDGAIFNNLGSFEARDDANIATQSGVVAFNNAGTFQKSAGTGFSGMFVPFNNSGTVTIQSGTLFLNGTYTQLAGSTVLNGGALQAAAPGTINIQAGTLSGFGNLTANLVNSGAASPGGQADPGLLNVIGSSTTQDPNNASLNFRIGGRTPGTDFDKLAVTGNAVLGGTLNVSLIGGFTPVAGDSFSIATFGSGAGSFGVTNLPPLPGGLTWNVQYTPTSLTLGVLGP
jgi:hypothetical protein